MRKAFLAVLLALVFLFSCSKNKKNVTPAGELSKAKTAIQVYCFSQIDSDKDSGGVLRFQSVSECPRCDFLPWTESVRISGMGFFDGEACFIVNKVGVFSIFNLFNQTVDIFPSPLFPFFTVSGFYNTDVGFLVKSYKNTMFEGIGSFEEEKFIHEELPILNRYNPITKDLEPILFPHHFRLPSYSALTELRYNGAWFASFKLDNGKDVEFRYFKFNNINDILNANYTSIASDEFMSAMLPILEDDVRFLSLPEPVIRLIKCMEERSVSIEYFDSNYMSPLKIMRNTGKANNLEIAKYEAVAFSNRTKECCIYAVLLSSGKLYIYNEKADVSDVYLLPELPKDSCYTYVALHEDIVLAGWEEQDFFECGRAGFIASPLDKLNKL